MKTPRSAISEAIASHMYYTDVRGTKEYVRDRKKYIDSVASYLLETRRTGELDSILRDISADWARVGYVEVLASSAHPLDASTKRDIAAKAKALYPNADEIVVTEVLEPSVIGGVRISIADQRLDLSVEAKLNKFKQLTGAGKE